MAANESLDLQGPAGLLEAILMLPDQPPVAAAVVCHAHPLHGGVMHFKPVFRAARALQAAGLAALRFNFRGVGRSQGAHDHGRGEQDDARAALDFVERRFPGLPLVLGGFSFGSEMALRVAAADSRPRALFVLGYPVTRPSTEGSPLDAVRIPRLFVQGARDQFGGEQTIRELVATLPEPRRLVVVPDSDHFFTGHLDRLQQEIEAWARERPWAARSAG